MALKVEDIANKKFTSTKYKEGYNQDEVEHFLDDEVVPAFEELAAENERLTQELETAHATIQELRDGSSGSATGDHGADDELDDDTHVADGVAVPVGDESATATPESESKQGALHAGATAATSSDSPESANGLIAIAQRVHDEHIQNGKTESARMIREAQAESKEIVEGANETARLTLTNLNDEREMLEEKIDGLRTFERDYRTRLKNYLDSQLRDLNANASHEQPGKGI